MDGSLNLADLAAQWCAGLRISGEVQATPGIPIMKFLSVYNKLESLVNRLPEALQKPILQEITPIKTLFLLQHPPRLVLLGQRGAGKAEVVNALFGAEIIRQGEEDFSDGGWQSYSQEGRGILQLLDARSPVCQSMAQTSLAAQPADLYIFLQPVAEGKQIDAAHLRDAVETLQFADRRHSERPKLLGLVVPGADLTLVDATRNQLHTTLHSAPPIAERLLGTLALTDPDRLVERIAIELPAEAQLEMARLSGNRKLQKELAQVVLKSATAICAAIGTQPIPLADFPILTSVQATLVGSIMHISGRDMSARAAGEFIAGLGANIGAGLILREGARAAAKLVPFWGNAISGAVAGAGTYAVGRAAVSYFIEGVSLSDAKSVFRRGARPKPLTLKK